ncbi:MAG: hypothetical protein LBP89_02490 [Helicobacteraceae bacterium]|jgi:hypothetical protein|nr:hypothetical protein [Helicobacteraceae bacterium]
MPQEVGLQVKKGALEAIEAFLDTGAHRDLIVEYVVKKGVPSPAKFSIVENGVDFFLAQGFNENGLKSFVKSSKTAGVKHGYVLFETQRLGSALSSLFSDLANIEVDLAQKIGAS